MLIFCVILFLGEEITGFVVIELPLKLTQETAVWRFYTKYAFFKNSQCARKTSVLKSVLNFIQKRFHCSCVPVNIAKFLQYWNTFGGC